MTKEEALTNIIAHLKHVNILESIQRLLEWDEQVNLPPESVDLRVKQQSVIAETIHNAFVIPEFQEWLDVLEGHEATFNQEEATIYRESKRDYEQAKALPEAFIKRRAESRSEAFHAWVQARKDNDYASFRLHLQTQLDIAKEEAEYQGYGDNPYDYAVDIFNPGMSPEEISGLLNELKEGLLPIVETITSSGITYDTSILKGFPVDKQRAFIDEVTEKLGFNYKRGRLDTAVHPFCGGHPLDMRITTRFSEEVPLDSLFSTIHETGHALYEQGHLKEWMGTPLSQYVGLGIHESQSRLWENQVGRSRSFWKYWEGRYRGYFSEQLKSVDSDSLYGIINAVSRNPIRIDADEVMYNLHIILRYELEQDLFSGNLSLEDLPEAWNNKSQEILGLTPDSDANGVLQDVHWSIGVFGYFPSYTIGNIISAQLWYKVLEVHPEIESEIAEGNYKTLLNWLRKNIHEQGKRYRTTELVQKVTGNAISPKPLLKYLSERYLPLYQKETAAI